MSIESYIHRFVPATEPNLPTVVALHGTGGNENDLIGLVQTVAPGCAILSPRGNVLERGMPRFFRRFAEGVFDLADVAHRAHELAGFVASAATHYQPLALATHVQRCHVVAVTTHACAQGGTVTCR